MLGGFKGPGLPQRIGRWARSFLIYDRLWPAERKRAAWWKALVMACAVLMGLLGYAYVSSLLAPVKPGSTDSIVITVPEGASTSQIARMLEERKLIKSAFMFRVLARYRRMDSSLKSGEYQLSSGMSPWRILDKLSRGQVIKYRFTIPEGYTVEQVAALLAHKGYAERERFLQAARDMRNRLEFLPDGEVDLKQPLEGYLFPDTYEITRRATETDIIELMLNRFRVKFNEEYRRRAKEMGMTVHQVVTLASIIEKEATIDEERPLISAVYHNRLKINMKLDADPTVQYALRMRDRFYSGGPVTYKDLEVDSPYNTYKYPGLPPGPIANPGEASIRAALYPAEANYLYFVSKNDGSHVFSRTYSEHLAAKRRYQPGSR